MEKVQSKGKSVLFAGLFSCGFLMSQIIASMILGIGYGIYAGASGLTVDTKAVEAFVTSPIALIFNYCFVALFVLLVLKNQKYMQLKDIRFNKISAKLVGLCFLLGFGFQSIGIAMNLIIGQFVDLSSAQESMMNALGGNLILTSIFVVIVAPIVEEFVFRGFVFTHLKKSLKLPLAIFIQGLFFALVHMNLFQLMPTLLLGIFLGYCMHKFKNIYVPILIHVFFNLYATLSFQIGEGFDLYIIAISALMLLAGSAVLYMMFKNKADDEKIIINE